MGEIEFRRRALRNMWTIIVSIFVVVTYSSLYSIILYFGADSECYVQQNVAIRSLSTVVQRSMQFIWWLYPVLWLFWPKEFSCRASHAANSASGGAQQRNGSGRVAHHVGQSETDDDDTSFAERSSTSYLNLSMQNAGSAMFGGACAT